MEKETTHYLFGIVLSGGANLFGMAASLFTIMVAARLLSQEELGAFFLVMLVAQFTVLFGDIGLQNTAIKTLSSLPINSQDFAQMSRYLLTVTAVTSLAACIGVTIASPLLTSLWPYQSFQSHAIYVAPVAFLTAMAQIAMSLLVGAKQFRQLSLLSVGIEVLRTLLSTGGLLAGYGISALFWGMILSRIVGIGAVWISQPSLFGLRLRHAESANLLRFGGWLYGCSLLSVLMIRASDAILTTYMGTAALAVYAAAGQIPSVLQRGFESIRPALLGYVSAHRISHVNPQIAAIRIVTAVLALTATALIPLSGWLMTVLYSEKYANGVMIMQALSVWTVFTILNYLYSIILIGNGYSKKAFLLTVPQLFVMLIVSSLLVPRYQGLGAAIALLITAFLANLFGAWLVAGNHKPSRYALIMGFIRAAIPLLLLLVAAATIATSLALLYGFACVTVVLLVLLKVVTAHDIKALRETLIGATTPVPARAVNA